MSNDKVKALIELRPNAKWIMVDDVIDWQDTKQTQPTESEIQLKISEIKVQSKLANIRIIRNQKLSETDYLGTSDNTMSDEMKTYRQSMRDIPQDYTTEEQYNELLARDEQGNLTHTVWSKP